MKPRISKLAVSWCTRRLHRFDGLRLQTLRSLSGQVRRSADLITAEQRAR